MAYNLTAQERRARAYQIAQNNKLQAQQQQAFSASAAAPKATPVQEEDDDHWLERVGATIGDVLSGIGYGAIKGVEGIVDAGATLIGGAADLFGADNVEKGVSDFTSYDFTSDLFGRDDNQGSGTGKVNLFDTQWGNELIDKSYLDEDSMVRSVAEGFGGMLPAVGVSLIPGVGAAAPAIMMGVQAGGQSAEEAFNEGASGMQALGYGTAMGAVEAATEKLGGIMAGGSSELSESVLGKFLIKHGKDDFWRKGIGKAMYTFGSEGLEEALTDVIQPGIKGGFDIGTAREDYFGKDAGENWGEVLKGLPKTFAVGGATGVLMGSLHSGINNLKNRDKGGGRYNAVAEEVQVILDRERADQALKRSGRATQEQVNKLETRIRTQEREAVERISHKMSKMTEAQRERAFAAAPILHEFIEADGAVKSDFMDALSEQIESGKATNTTANVFELSQIGEDTRAAVESYNEQHELTDGTEIRLYEGDLTAEERQTFSTIAQRIKANGERAGTDLKLAIIESNRPDLQAFRRGNTFFITKEDLTSGKWAERYSHELGHFASGTEGRRRLANYLAGETRTPTAGKHATAPAPAAEAQFALDQGEDTDNIPVLQIEIDSELSQRLAQNKTRSKYAVIQEYLVEKFYGETFVMSDGKSAIMDKSDAQKLSNLASPAKTAQLSNLKQIIENAPLYSEAHNVEHKKFNSFSYYRARVEFDGSTFDILVNVGKAKNDGTYHIYDITPHNKKGRTAGQASPGLSRVTKTGAIRNGSSNDSITENRENVKRNGENNSKTNFSLAAEGENTAQEAREDEDAPTLSEAFYEAKNEVLAAGYGVTEADIDSAWEKSLNGEEMTETEELAYEELVARLIDHALGTETSVRRMASKAPKLARMMLDRISDMVDTMRGTNADRAQTKKLRRAELMLEDALDEIRERNKKAEKAAKRLSRARDESDKYLSRVDEDAERELARLKAEFAALAPAERDAWLDAHADTVDREEFEGEVVADATSTDVDTDTWFALLTDEDLTEYMATGKTLHTRHKKQRMLESGKKPILTSEGEIREFISSAIHGKAGGEVRAFARVPKRLADAISEVRNTLDLEGDYLEFQADALREAYKVHSSPKMQGDIALTESDFENLHHHIFDFDGVLSVNDYNGKTEVHIYHRAEKGYYQIITVSSSERKSLQITKLIGVSKEKFEKKYAKKLERNTGSPRMLEASTPSTKARHTAGALSNGSSSADVLSVVTDESATTSTISINDNAEKNNPKSKKIFEKVDFSLSKASDKVVISKGEREKQRAQYQSDRVYHKKDIAEIVKSVKVFSLLPSATREELVNKLWVGVNARYYEDARKTFLSTMIDEAYYLAVQEAYSEEYVARLNNVQRQIRETRKLPESEERKAKLSKLQAELKELKANPELYFDTIEAQGEKAVEREIGEVLRGLLDVGTESVRAKLEHDFDRSRAGFWKAERDRIVEENKLRNVLQKIAGDILAQKKDTFTAASAYSEHLFKGTIEALANINYKGSVSPKKVRNALKNLREWYSLDNAFFYDKETRKQSEYYDENIAYMIDCLIANDRAFTTEDWQMLIDVFGFFKHMNESYQKVYRNGKLVDAMPLAKAYIEKIALCSKTKAMLVMRSLAKDRSYIRQFGDPAALFRAADQYDPNGFYTEVYEDLRRGAIGMAFTESELMHDYEEFLKKHKKYLDRLQNETVLYQSRQIPLNRAISLYMTTKRRQAWKGLIKSGFFIEMDVKDGKKTLERRARVEFNELLAPGQEIQDHEIEGLVKQTRDALYSHFSEADKEFIKIIEKTLNEECSALKRQTDLARMGYSNVDEGGYYYPIQRADTSQSVDTDPKAMYADLDLVSHLSMNADLVEGAAGRLLIRPVEDIFLRHVKQVAMYSNLAIPFDSYNRILNLNTDEANRNKPVSVRSETSRTALGQEMNKYLRELIEDVQGAGKGNKNSWWHKTVSFVRSGYAKAQLGGNPKVWLTQLSSFIAATDMLDYGCLVKGVSMSDKWKEVDQYCHLAMIRNKDNVAAHAQGVLDKTTGKVGDVLMKPIGWCDRFVVGTLFGACQVQIQKNGGAKVGTEENKKAAGELLERVILETQQNALSTERSAAMRSGDELLKSLTMFSADSMKVFARVLDAYGEVATLRRRLQMSGFSEEQKAAMKAQLKRAHRKAVRTTTALVASAAFMAALALFFRWLYRKEEEKTGEERTREIIADTVGNLLGGLPFIRDVYSYFSDGYELDNFMLSTINDLLLSTQETVNMSFDLIQGKDVPQKDITVQVRKSFYAAGQLFGIPVRNMYNHTSGLIKRFFPETGYKLENHFYSQNYRADLQRALENEDEEMLATIVGIMLDEKVGGIESSAARKALNELVLAGHDVIPSGVPESLTLTYKEEEYAVSDKDRKIYKQIYLGANEKLAEMVRLKTFQNATDEEKAAAIDLLYSSYKTMAKYEVLEGMGVELEEHCKIGLFAEAMDLSKLVSAVAVARAFESDKDKHGKVIAGSKKKKVIAYVQSLNLTAVEKYMIMGFLGYTNTKGKTAVRAHINSLNLAKSEKAQLLKWSGYPEE